MITVCIVNYKTFEMTLNAIDSILKFETNKVNIIVIDNGSGNLEKANFSKGLCDRGDNTRDIIYINNSENMGFAKANNQAIRCSTDKFIALLNSDTELTTNAFTKAIDFLNKSPDVGVVSCHLITPDGKLDYGCKRGFPTPKASLFYFLKLSKLFKRQELDGYHLAHLDENLVHDVDVVSGAFMVLRREVIDSVGLLDERFFMYGEDIDWCYRIKEAGWRIVYNPELGDVIHYKGSSAKKRKFKTLFNFYEAMFLFYNKHYLKKYNPFVTLLVYIGIVLQFIVKLIKNYVFIK